MISTLLPHRLLFVLCFLGQAIGVRVLWAQTESSDIAAIQELGRQFSAALIRGDAVALTSIYTTDAVIFPERSDAITGREAIQRYWTPRPGSRVTRHVLTPTRIVIDGRHAYDYGTYEIAGEREGKPWGPFKGKYVVVWRKNRGAWRMQLDIWNSGPEGSS